MKIMETRYFNSEVITKKKINPDELFEKLCVNGFNIMDLNYYGFTGEKQNVFKIKIRYDNLLGFTQKFSSLIKVIGRRNIKSITGVNVFESEQVKLW